MHERRQLLRRFADRRARVGRAAVEQLGGFLVPQQVCQATFQRALNVAKQVIDSRPDLVRVVAKFCIGAAEPIAFGIAAVRRIARIGFRVREAFARLDQSAFDRPLADVDLILARVRVGAGQLAEAHARHVHAETLEDTLSQLARAQERIRG